MRTVRMLVWRLKNFVFSWDGFATAPVWWQLLVLFALSAGFILLFHPLLGRLSFDTFFDPAMFYDVFAQETSGIREILSGFLLVIAGLLITGFIISILTTGLETFLALVKSGTLPFRGKGHVVIVNGNSKLKHMLGEINTRMADLGVPQDVVIILRNEEQLEECREILRLERFPYLGIALRQGNLYSYETFRRLGVEQALGLVILRDEDFEDDFQADNDNLKILAVLTNEVPFRKMLYDRLEGKIPMKFTVEITDTVIARGIAESLAVHKCGTKLVSILNSDEVIARVLTRSMVDITYYKVYFELLSFSGHEIYFLNPERFGQLSGKAFEELAFGFTRGILIGMSSFTDGRLVHRICPFGQKLQPGDWVILIGENENEMVWDPAAAFSPDPSRRVKEPPEIVSKRICVVGDRHQFQDIVDFLDEQSRREFESNRITLEAPSEYFSSDFVMKIKEKNFDNVVINLDDENAFRLTLFMLSLFGRDDPFLAKIITVIDNPVIEDILNRNAKYRNTILSDKLAARFVTQLTFQKNLEPIFRELMSPDGYEFNILEIGRDIPREWLTTRAEVKRLLLSSGIVYVGTATADKQVSIDNDSFATAQQLVVLARGEA